jgi:putative NIF3 family GTP cyclohydrolase 1 type 2
MSNISHKPGHQHTHFYLTIYLISFRRTNITPVPNSPEAFKNAGYGRILRFSEPVPLSWIIRQVTKYLSIPGVSVATPQWLSLSSRPSHPISSVGICAGSGGSMLANVDVDLWFTGEVSHHEALAAIEKGTCVITTFHSNSERAFFRNKMHDVLGDQIRRVILDLESKGQWEGEDTRNGFDVGTSEADADPFSIVKVGDEGW